MARLVALCGAAGAGKGEVAKILNEVTRDCSTISFAQTIKEIAFNMGWNGKKDTKGRRLLQLIGTECGRECISKDIWVNRLIERYANQETMFVCVDDLRFDNELKAIKLLGGSIWKITGRGEEMGSNAAHSSEAGIPVDQCDYEIINSGTIDNLLSSVVTTLGCCKWI